MTLLGHLWASNCRQGVLFPACLARLGPRQTFSFSYTIRIQPDGISATLTALVNKKRWERGFWKWGSVSEDQSVMCLLSSFDWLWVNGKGNKKENSRGKRMNVLGNLEIYMISEPSTKNFIKVSQKYLWKETVRVENNEKETRRKDPFGLAR